VLGTLSAAGAAVKRFEKFHFPPNVDNGVETMCIAPSCFVDQSRESDHHTAELVWKPCGNLYEHWSDLFCLAIYVGLSSAD